MRRVTGWCSVGCIPLTVVAFVAGGTAIGIPAIVFSLAAPALAMIVHLGVTDEIGPEEKALWRRELWFGHRALGAAWTYLLPQDLKAATRALADERA